MITAFETDVLVEQALELADTKPLESGTEMLFCDGKDPAAVEFAAWSRGSPVSGAIVSENGICEMSMPALPGASVSSAIAKKLHTAEC